MGADEERTEMRTHSPAYRYESMFGQEQPVTGRASLAPALHSSTDRPIELPSLDGAEALISAMKEGSGRDVVILDGHALGNAGLEALNALVLGADDTAANRPEIAAQIAMLSTLLRSERGSDATDAKMPFTGHLRLDMKTCQAYWKERSVNLTITEFNIVKLFAERIGENLSYREIYDVVHGPGFCAGDGVNGFQTNVRSLIKRIRQKFHDADPQFCEIDNHRGYGYRWRMPEPAAEAMAPARHLTERNESTPESSQRRLLLIVGLVNSAAG